MPIVGNIVKRGVSIGKKLASNRPPAAIQQQKAFVKLLSKAKNTSFGRKYRFEEILHSEDPEALFREIVPMSDYEGMRPWWLRTERGELDVVWPGRIKYFALTSGTSGAPSKEIPVTKDQVKAIRRASIRQLISLSKYNLDSSIFQTQTLTLAGSTQLQDFGHHFKGDVSGINVKHLPRYTRLFHKPGKKISASPDWEDRLQKMVQAAPDWDIGIVAGVPAWFDILMERLEERYNLKSIHELWPNLQVYLHGGVSITPYVKKLNTHFSKKVHFIETYLASEGFIALQDRPDAMGMELLANNGIYFEFIPFSESSFGDDGRPLDPHCKTLKVDELELDKPYAIVMSTCAGAWRYLIGDVVKFRTFDPPELIIDGRTKHFLSMVGEHLSIDNMTQGLANASAELGLSITEFTVAGIQNEVGFAHQWYIGSDQGINSEEFSRVLDQQLRELNDDYGVERDYALKQVLVQVIPASYFNEYLGTLGKQGAQVKFPRVMKGDQYQGWLTFLEEKES